MANTNIGVTISAKDQATPTIGNISNSFVKLNKTMQTVGVTSGKMTQTFITADGQMMKFSKTLGKTSKTGISAMLSLQSFVAKIVHYITFSIGVQMVMQIRQGFSEMIEDFKEFERAATNAATVSGHLGGSFDKIKEHIMEVSKELGRSTIFSALDVSKAFYNLASAGYEISEMGSKDLIPILNYAAATQSTLEEATYAVSTALKAFSLDMEDATKVVDIFTGAITNSFMTFDKMREAMKYVGPIAGALGISLEETVSALMLLVDRGMEGSQAGQRLNMIFTKLLKPTEKTEAMLAAMGLTMDDLNPEVYTLTEILYKLKAAGFGAAEAATMFRARTAASATVLVNAVDDIERYNHMLINTRGITEGVAEQQEKTLWGAFQLMGNALQEAGLQIAEDMLPALLDLASFVRDKVAPTLVWLVGIFKTYAPTIKFIITTLLAYKVAMAGIVTVQKIWSAILGIKLAFLKKESTQSSIMLGLLGKEAQERQTLIALRKSELAAEAGSAASQGMQVALAWKGVAARDKESASIIRNTLVTERNNIAKSGIVGASMSAAAYRTLSADACALEASAATASANAIMFEKAAKAGNIKVTEGLVTVNKGLIASLKSLWATMIANPITLLLAAIAVITAALYIFVFRSKDLNLVMKDQGVIIKHAAEELGQYDVALYEAMHSSKTLNESLGLLAEEGFKDLRDSTTDAIQELANMEEFAFREPPNVFMQALGPIGIPVEFIISTIFPDPLKEFYGGVPKEYLIAKAEELGLDVEAIEAKYEEWRVTQLLANEMVGLSLSIRDVNEAKEEEKQAYENLETVRKSAAADQLDDINLLVDAEEKYIAAKEKRASLEADLLGSVKGVLTELRSYTEGLDDGIGYLEEISESSERYEKINNDLTISIRNQEHAANELAKSLADWGANDDRTIDAEIRLQQQVERTAELQGEISNILEDKAKAQKKYQYLRDNGITGEYTMNELMNQGIKTEEDLMKATGKSMEYLKNHKEEQYKVTNALSSTELRLLKISEQMIEARDLESDKLAEQALLKAKIDALDMVRDKYLTFTNEKLKLYLEAQADIYDIEEKLYKLREGEKDQFDELFQKLAEEGLLNEEIIDLYREMMVAEGEVMSLNKEFTDAYGELNTQQQEDVTEAMTLYQDLLKAGVDAEVAAQIAFEGIDASSLGIDLDALEIEMPKIDLTGVDTSIFLDMANAQYDLNTAVGEFGDYLGPLMDDFIEMGVLSSDIVEAWGDIADNAMEAAQGIIDLAIATTKADDTMIGLIGNTSRLAMALQDEDGETFADVMDELIDRMELTGDIAGSNDEQLKALNDFYKDGRKSLKDYSDAEIIAALSMIQAAQASGLWKEEMSGATLATDMHMGSLQAFINEAEMAYDAEEDLESLNKDLIESENLLANATSDLTRVFNEFLDLMGGRNVFSVSLQYSFGELLNEQYSAEKDLTKLFSDMNEMGVDLTADMMKSWQDQDWESFAEYMTGPFGELFAESLSNVTGEAIDIAKMDKDDWKELFLTEDGLLSDVVSDNLDTINSLFQDMEVFAHIRTIWDDYPEFSEFAGNLKSNISTIEPLIESAFPTVDIDSSWENQDFETWLQSLKSEDLEKLNSVLEGTGLSVPIDLEKQVEDAAITARTKLSSYFEEPLEVGIEFTEADMINEIKRIIPDKPLTIPLEPAKPKSGWEGFLEGAQTGTFAAGPLFGGIAGGILGALGIGTSVEPPVTGTGTEIAEEFGEEVLIGGRAVSNIWEESIVGSTVKLEGSLDTASNHVMVAFDESTGQVLGTFDVATQTFSGGVAQATQGSVGLIEQETGLFVGSMDVVSKDITYSQYLAKESVLSSSDYFYNKVIEAADYLVLKTGGGDKSDNESVWWNPFTWGKGGIALLQKGITETKGPLSAIIGEAGSEAVVPLEGANKKYGRNILQQIIPKYFPDLAFMQGGGVVGGDTSIGKLFESAFSSDALEKNSDMINKLREALKGSGIDMEELDKLIPLAAQKFSDDVVDSAERVKFAYDWVIRNEKRFALDRIKLEDIGTANWAKQVDDAGGFFKEDVIMSTFQMQSDFDNISSDWDNSITGTADSFNNDILGTARRWDESISLTAIKWDTAIGLTAESFYEELVDVTAVSFRSSLESTATAMKNIVVGGLSSILAALLTLSARIMSMNIRVTHSHTYSYHHYYHFGFAQGGIVGFQKGGMIKGEQQVTVGEEGPEAIIPLTGINRKHGKKLLDFIIPKYYPEYMGKAAEGGLFGNMGNYSNYYDGGTNNIEEYNINGPITVTGVSNVDQFMEGLKMRARTVGARR